LNVPSTEFWRFSGGKSMQECAGVWGPGNRPDPSAAGDRGVPRDYSMPAVTGENALRRALGHAAGTGSYVHVYLRPR
jgi:hypothetical protein